MDKLITANAVAKKRFGKKNHREWMKRTSERFLNEGRLRTMWNGKDVKGRAVQAVVSSGRLLAVCDICENPEYVEEGEPFYCMVCGNGDKTHARPVEFPDDWEAVKKALLKREIVLGKGKDLVERVYRSRPKIAGLGRDWQFGVSAEELEAENDRL